jgi:predicted DNA-binding transcriptional regulator AlpA
MSEVETKIDERKLTKIAEAREIAKARELWKFSHLKLLGYVDDRATCRRLMASSGFPKPLILSANSIAWVAAEVRAWLENRPRGAAPQPQRPRKPAKAA